MRIFAALRLPGDVTDRIEEWQKPLEIRYPHLKWVKPENAHLTLRFFGDVNESILENVRLLLSAWHPGLLAFTLDRIGSFGPANSPPSVFWLGGTFPKAVQKVAGRLGLIPDDRGRIDKRTFLPHITVARNRGSSDPPVLNGPATISGEFSEAVIYNSRLTQYGPEYSSIGRFDLR